MARPKTPASTRPARGDLWAVDFEPQTHKEEPGKRGRPALIIQTDALNHAGHPSTLVIPGTSRVDRLRSEDQFPLRVPLQAEAGLPQITDLLIDQLRAVSNRRLLRRLGAVPPETLKRAQEALNLLIGA